MIVVVQNMCYVTGNVFTIQHGLPLAFPPNHLPTDDTQRLRLQCHLTNVIQHLHKCGNLRKATGCHTSFGVNFPFLETSRSRFSIIKTSNLSGSPVARYSYLKHFEHIYDCCRDLESNKV